MTPTHLWAASDGGTGLIGPPVVVAIVLWGVLFAALAWALTTLWLKHRQNAKRPSIDEVRSWPVTDASVIECTIHMLGSGAATDRGEVYYPAVRYEFVVDDLVYVDEAPVGIMGRRQVAGTRVEAEQSLRGFRIGDRIKVRYDPADPYQSRLYDIDPDDRTE